MNVEEIMTPDLEVCTPDTTLAEAAMKMWHNDCGALPVADGENRIMGMVTDRDICIGLATRGKSPDTVRVADVMSSDIRSCSPDDQVRSAMDTMARARVRRLPVVNADGELCGMLSLNDIILRAEHKKPGGRGKAKLSGITYDDAMQTLKAVSTHWTAATADGAEKRNGR